MKRLAVVGSDCSVATINPCRLCAPLGASLAIRGISGAMPILHGSQGCATYIRRYLVSHYREPMDVASSSFGENEAIFGGASNLGAALDNVLLRYQPDLVGVATTCLAETIGDDVPGIVKRWMRERGTDAPLVVHASTPAYSGSHAEGYSRTVAAIIEQLAEGGDKVDQVNLLTPMSATPADIRHLKSLGRRFGLNTAVIPDFSETLDGPSWTEYQSIPPGGTTIAQLRNAGRALATISFEGSLATASGAGPSLEKLHGVPNHDVGLPIGIEASDRLMAVLSELSGTPIPDELRAERGRLVDAMIDAHKILFERRVALIGDQDLVLGLAVLCRELGLSPVLCVTSGNAGRLRPVIEPLLASDGILLEDSSHDGAEHAAKEMKLDLVLGPSRTRSWSRKLQVPLVHLGFPVHDRFGAARIKTFGYEGALELLDRVTNALLEHRQTEAGLGWAYL